MGVKLPRQCCRPGCSRAAVATLTFVYAESTAVIGPLATSDEPHSWDLCGDHAARITVPRGWQMLRSERGFSAPVAEDYELTALAEAVREVGAAGGGAARGGRPFRNSAGRPGVGFADAGGAGADQDLFDEVQSGRHRSTGPVLDSPPADGGRSGGGPHRSGAVKPRPGRRGHLRVLPDPID